MAGHLKLGVSINLWLFDQLKWWIHKEKWILSQIMYLYVLVCTPKMVLTSCFQDLQPKTVPCPVSELREPQPVGFSSSSLLEIQVSNLQLPPCDKVHKSHPSWASDRTPNLKAWNVWKLAHPLVVKLRLCHLPASSREHPQHPSVHVPP